MLNLCNFASSDAQYCILLTGKRGMLQIPALLLDLKTF